jgi:glutaredoxin
MESVVVIYTLPTCGGCIKVKNWLTDKGISFRDVDVNTMKPAEFSAKFNTTFVPVVTVGPSYHAGSDLGAVESFLRFHGVLE